MPARRPAGIPARGRRPARAMSWSTSPRPARGPALLWVLAAHLVLAWWLVIALRPAPRALIEAPALWLRWVAPPDAPTPPAPGPRPQGSPPAPRPAPPRWSAPPPVPSPPAPAAEARPAPQPQAITLPPVPTEAGPTGPHATGTISSGPAPLDLRLPQAASRPPPSLAARLREDPRLREPPTTATQRIARALDPTITEEALPDGSRRFRRGNDCVIARPSRAGQIDPFDSTRPRPWLVGEC